MFMVKSEIIGKRHRIDQFRVTEEVNFYFTKNRISNIFKFENVSYFWSILWIIKISIAKVVLAIRKFDNGKVTKRNKNVAPRLLFKYNQCRAIYRKRRGGRKNSIIPLIEAEFPLYGAQDWPDLPKSRLQVWNYYSRQFFTVAIVAGTVLPANKEGLFNQI